jgi:hypothetical protein
MNIELQRPYVHKKDERIFAVPSKIVGVEVGPDGYVGEERLRLRKKPAATPGISSFDDEQQSEILHKLSDLTRKLHVTLIIIDHVRKHPGPGRRAELSIDDIKGTGGKAQNADCVILMQRTPDKKQIKFQCFSKDFEQPVRILINVAPKGSKDPKFLSEAAILHLKPWSEFCGAAHFYTLPLPGPTDLGGKDKCHPGKREYRAYPGSF